jgi:putative transposase
MTIREKSHRLPEGVYLGEVSVSFTLCVKDRFPLFQDTSLVSEFTEVLKSLVKTSSCIIPVYCFMPDHQHLIVSGTNPDSNILHFIRTYKQSTGYWLSRQQIKPGWQKDFFDHVLRKDEDLAAAVKYILANPVRKCLVAHWQDYPLKGAIGCQLEDILQGMV